MLSELIMPDTAGAIVGTLCIVSLAFLFWKCDSVSDGNVGADK